MTHTKPNKNLKPSEINSFLNFLKKIKIRNWEKVGFHNGDWHCKCIIHSKEIWVWVTRNGVVKVSLIDLCVSEEFYQDLGNRFRKRETQLAYLKRKKVKDDKEKVLNMIRDLK